MNEVKITITGAGSTFGVITKSIELLLKEFGADVILELDDKFAIMPIEEAEKYINQIKGRTITINTESLPWSG